MNLDTLALAPMWYCAFLFSTVAHEAAHAWTARRLGDPTAYHEGQVSLDPRPHIRREPVGTVLFPILSFVVSGWMMGWASAPFDPLWAERYPRKAAWMALAGPLANLGIAVIVGIAIRAGVLAGVFDVPHDIRFTHVTNVAVGSVWEGPAIFLSILFTLNILLFTFNLIPVYPLDGSTAIMLLMDERLGDRYREVVLNSSFSMIGLFIAWRVFEPLFIPVFRTATRCLYPGAF